MKSNLTQEDLDTLYFSIEDLLYIFRYCKEVENLLIETRNIIEKTIKTKVVNEKDTLKLNNCINSITIYAKNLNNYIPRYPSDTYFTFFNKDFNTYKAREEAYDIINDIFFIYN